MQKTSFEIPKMDCPSEENLIRMKLNDIPTIKHLDFDLAGRKLSVFHQGQLQEIERTIETLDLGGKKINSEPVTEQIPAFEDDSASQRKLLWSVLLINFAFFLIEMTTGLLSRSMGLLADSLDMLADAWVYGLSLLAVGGTVSRKKRVALLAGYFQLALAILGFVEVLRRFFGQETTPDFTTMIVVSVFALIANALCLYLLQKSRNKEEAHMQASMIFTSNDVIINLGVIVAGALVHWLNSNKPDLIIGTIVFVLVTQGAIRIIRLGK